MLKKFIIEENLSIDDLETMNNISKYLEKTCIDNYLFCGYPYFNGREGDTVLKCAFINKYGIFIVTSSIDDFKKYRRYIMQELLSSYKLSDAIDNDNLFYQLDNISNLAFDNKYVEKMNDELISEAVSILQNTYNLIKNDTREISSEGTIGYYIKKRSEEIANYDESQFDGIYQNNTSHVRIRGLAGSGKTIVLVKKMAFLHFKNKNAKMCYVFYTISLKQYILKLFREFYKEFDRDGEPDFSKVCILHCWGGKANEGFYSKICNEVDTTPFTYNEGINLEAVSKSLLDNIKYNLEMFDYVFLDEAQDFGINFFKLIKISLTDNGKLIYAYDEMQSLDDKQNSIPSKHAIFGAEKCEDIDLKRCYRTPNEILITAHALGLGIYRNDDNPIVNIIEDIKVWEAIGYEVIDGKLGYGQNVVLSRKKIYDNMIENPIKYESFNNVNEQYAYLVNEIARLIKFEDVRPEDILIIDLDNKNIKQNSTVFKHVFFETLASEELFHSDNQWNITINVVDKNNPKLFSLSNSIGYTTIYRAKGNEANIVFIINSDTLSSLESISRNKLFTAMTRSKFLVYILSSNKNLGYDEEIKKVRDNNYCLKFKYPTKDEMKLIKTNSKLDVEAEYSMDSAIKSYKTAIEKNKNIEIELLLKQTGKESIDELVKYLEEMKKHD